MKMIVISDTHMPNRGQEFPPVLIKELKSADLIIHAGDWNTIDVYEKLKGFGRVEGVYGNTDQQEILETFPKKMVLNAEGYSIGVVHGDGKGKTTEKRALEAFDERPDIIIFGHSHIPYARYSQGTLLFNPGSATDKRKQPYYSFGIIEIESEIKSQHIFYKSKSG
ncbi:metallophosphoesterase family protein [Bacillus sp. SG-1]|uniref:metallophosphoesterase family protein n=1 Tax=Bacillus sp. SG-1 TaxID=161544 RepID=UPI0002D77F59|nr:metallophosphoesterase family protein [Bacillus sp. SG-1]